MSQNDASGEREIAPGTLFGAYRVVRTLGRGAFGVVYEATKEPLGKRVALKVLLRQWSENPNVTERFLQEARAAASLRHAHIVDVDDIGVFDSMPWIAMEYLEGESLLAKLQREHHLSVAESLRLMMPVCSAVAAVHDRGIIHRDLKPENVQLWRGTTGAVHPKLLDFGIAKVTEGVSHAMTSATDLMGTPEYMAPEQWRGAKYVTTASDQWALGVMLYRCLSGVSPFDADSPASVMYRATMDPLAPIQVPLPPGLEQVLIAALSKDPTARYASVRAFATALLPFADVGTQQQWAAEFGVNTSTSATAIGPGTPTPSVYVPSKTSFASPVSPFGPANTLAGATRDVAAPSGRKPMVAGALATVGLLAAGLLWYAHGTAATSPTTPPHAAAAAPTPAAPTPTPVVAPAAPTPVVAPAAPAPTPLAPAAPAAPVEPVAAPAPTPPAAPVAAPAPTPPAAPVAAPAPTPPAAPVAAPAPAVDNTGTGRHHRRRNDRGPEGYNTAPMGNAVYAPTQAPSLGTPNL